MNAEIREALRSLDIGRWPKARLEFGKAALDIAVPPKCETLSMEAAVAFLREGPFGFPVLSGYGASSPR